MKIIENSGPGCSFERMRLMDDMCHSLLFIAMKRKRLLWQVTGSYSQSQCSCRCCCRPWADFVPYGTLQHGPWHTQEDPQVLIICPPKKLPEAVFSLAYPTLQRIWPPSRLLLHVKQSRAVPPSSASPTNLHMATRIFSVSTH